MGKIYDSFRTELVKYKRSVEAIGGLITVLLGMGILLTRLIDSKYNLAIISIGAFFLTNKVCRQIITSNRESFGVITKTYSKRVINAAKIARLVSYLFWIFPVFLLAGFVVPARKECSVTPDLGLLITNFTGADHDDFSYVLFNKIESELQTNDTINTIRTDEFVNAGLQHYQDSIKTIFSNYCFDHGLLVYGRRDQNSKLFNCNIYIENLKRIRTNTLQFKGQSVIYLQNPDLISFSIDSQANVVSEFILGLLYYNNNDPSIANARFQNALQLNSNAANKKLISYCHLFLGNSFYKERDFTRAIDEYRKGVAYDSDNAYLHFNMANALLCSSSMGGAKYEYDVVKKINPGLLNNSIFGLLSETGLFDSSMVLPASSGHNKKDRAIQPFPSHADQITKVNSQKRDSIPQSDFHLICKDGKYGLANKNDNTIVACEYDSIYMKEFIYRGKGYIIAQRSSKFGALNEKGGIEIPFNHPSAERVMSVIQLLVDYTN